MSNATQEPNADEMIEELENRIEERLARLQRRIDAALLNADDAISHLEGRIYDMERKAERAKRGW